MKYVPGLSVSFGTSGTFFYYQTRILTFDEARQLIGSDPSHYAAWLIQTYRPIVRDAHKQPVFQETFAVT